MHSFCDIICHMSLRWELTSNWIWFWNNISYFIILKCDKDKFNWKLIFKKVGRGPIFILYGFSINLILLMHFLRNMLIISWKKLKLIRTIYKDEILYNLDKIERNSLNYVIAFDWTLFGNWKDNVKICRPPYCVVSYV